MVQRKELILQLDTGEQYQQEALHKLNSMMRLATSEVCRHQSIASYFGDRIEPCKTQCDNCLNPHHEKTEITREAQMFLSAIYRSDQRFGQAYVIDILMGSKNQKIIQNGHESLSVYGIGKERSRSEWFSIADRLLELDTVARGEYQVLKLTSQGRDILKGKQTVEIREDRLRVEKSPTVKRTTSYDDVDMDTFDALRKLRAEIAKVSGVPAYIVFGDKTLKEMATTLPVTKEAMLDVNGVGEVKFERYGEQFLQLCKMLKGE